MNELLRLSITKSLVDILPARLKYKTAKIFYDYNSPKNKGINLVINYDLIENLNMLINTKEYIGWNIFFRGYYEQDTNRIIKDYIDKDDIVIEAGSNNGSETLIIGAILKNGKGKLYAFEPEPSVCEKLQYNIELNKLGKKISAIPLALGDENKDITFYLMPVEAANQGMSSKYFYIESKRTIKVKQIKLDEWCSINKIGRINFIKMDIQGSELDLLRGAENTIKMFKPRIFTEASETEMQKRNLTLKDLWIKLSDFEYEVKLIKEKELIDISSIHEIKEGNWLCIPKRVS